jgi:hypothetical protein
MANEIRLCRYCGDLQEWAQVEVEIGLGEIDREARKEKSVPSDYALLVIDIDSPGHPFDAGWASADSRIAARRPPNQR